MTTVNESVLINASTDKVWSLLTTPELILQWYAGLDSLEATPDYPAVGSSFTWTYSVAGIGLKGTYKVLDITPRQSIRYQIDGPINGSQDWQIEGADGAVSVKVKTEYGLQKGVLGKIAEPIIHQVNASNGKQSMANLKQLAETS